MGSPASWRLGLGVRKNCEIYIFLTAREISVGKSRDFQPIVLESAKLEIDKQSGV